MQMHYLLGVGLIMRDLHLLMPVLARHEGE